MLSKLVAILAVLALTQAKYIRLNNTGTQDFLYVVSAFGYEPNPPVLLEAGNFEELATLDEWQGGFYILPVNCTSIENCNYPVTVIEVAFGVLTFGNFYDYYIINIVNGFNVPASIKSIFNSNCKHVSCSYDLLSRCPEENQIKDDANVLVSCLSTPGLFQALCPEAMVNPTDLNIYPCASDYYEFTFG